MLKKLIVLVSVILVAGLTTNVMAGAWTDLAPADHLWSTPGNWTDNILPGSTSSTRLYPTIDPSADWPIIQDGIDAVSGSLTITWNRRPENETACTDPYLTITGGSLTLGSSSNPSGETLFVSYSDTGVEARAGDIYQSGGVVNCYGVSHLGQGGPGTLTMTGGEFNAHYLKVGQRADRVGYGYMNLYGGILTCTSGTDFRVKSLVDITLGTWVINGDVTSAMASAITDGRLIAYGGAGDVIVDYDGTNTTVTGIPEPMTIALLGLGGLFIRRRK